MKFLTLLKAVSFAIILFLSLQSLVRNHSLQALLPDEQQLTTIDQLSNKDRDEDVTIFVHGIIFPYSATSVVTSDHLALLEHYQ